MLKWQKHLKKKGGHPENQFQKARIRAGLTQAEAVGFFPFELRTLQAYEAGDSSPLFVDAQIMAKVYRCRLEDFSSEETTELGEDDLVPFQSD